MSNFSKNRGLADIAEGLAMWRLWLRMGWMETVRRYRRTTFGPFWTTLSLAVLVLAIGTIYPAIFRQEMSSYMPFLCAGLILWMPLSSFLSESGSAFLSGSSIIQQRKIPYSIFILSAIVRNVIVIGHHLIVFLILAIIFDVQFTMNTFLVIPGMILFILNGFWIGLLIAIFCTRYRDLLQVIMSVVQILFFVTPVFWRADGLEGMRMIVVLLNPIHHIIDIVRTPMLGGQPASYSWMIAGGLLIFGTALSMVLFNKYRSRIIYWI